MNILLIGYSNISQKRILPALESVGIKRVDVASLSKSQSVVLPGKLNGKTFNDYATALSETNPDLVYISTVNSLHSQWVKKALDYGYNVIVDKPAFIKLEDTYRMIDLAQKKKCCLAEANVYGYHPQIQAAKNAFDEVNSHPTCLNVTFSFPPIDSKNFRYFKKYGGGSLWDLGAYAISPGRIFFNDKPEKLYCHIRESNGDVETAFSMMATYPNDRTMVGQFGFNTGYKNQIDILGPEVTVTIDRVFTPPADIDVSIKVNQYNQDKTVKIMAEDIFALFFKKVIQSIKLNQLETFVNDMLYDAIVLDKLRKVGFQVGVKK